MLQEDRLVSRLQRLIEPPPAECVVTRDQYRVGLNQTNFKTRLPCSLNELLKVKLN